MVKLLLLLTFTLCACKHDEPTVLPLSNDWNNKSWDYQLETQLRENIALFEKAKDIKDWCPQYDTLPHLRVWHNLFVLVSYYESSHNPKAYYMEASGVPSLGLYQLSTPDEMPWCLHTTEKQLYDPLNNITCAVTLMGKLIERDGVLAVGDNNRTARGAARYWAVMRGGTYPGHVVGIIKKQMREFCGNTTTAGK